MTSDWVLYVATIGAIFWVSDFVGGYVRRGEDFSESVKAISVLGGLACFVASFLIARRRSQSNSE
jgi:hypothetical protein